MPESEWELGLEVNHLKIYRKLKSEGALFMVKCHAKLPNIPKEVAFNAISDLQIRK